MQNNSRRKGGIESKSKGGGHANRTPVTIRAHSSYQVRSEQKATHVLGLVFAAFTVCWTPFFTLNILMGIKRDLQVSDTLATTFLWLGYLSSTVNPVIYTIFNRNFRTAFKNILCCRSFSAAHQPSVSTSSTRAANKGIHSTHSPQPGFRARRGTGGVGVVGGANRNLSPGIQTCIL